jgi:hypothetical protein
MKHKNRILIFPSIIMGFLLMLATSCEDDKNLPDYASEIVGAYYGTVNIVGTGTVSGSSILTKRSEQVIDLEVKIGLESTSLNRIDVSMSGGDIYNLKKTDSSGSFTGKVEGNLLTWTLTDGSTTIIFSGTK